MLTGDDMAGWEAHIEAPLTYDYGRYTACKAGVWSQGPVMLQQLALLKGFDLDADAYRRRIRVVTTAPGVIESDLQDDFHHFEVTLTHDEKRVTAISMDARRWPWTTCPDAGGSLGRRDPHAGRGSNARRRGNERCRLEPLDPAAHGEQLFEASMAPSAAPAPTRAASPFPRCRRRYR